MKKPKWLKVKLPTGQAYKNVRGITKSHDLHTICESGNCPNMGECWGQGTATFMILGNICTRSCGFCNVMTGKPLAVDVLEPKKVARSIKLVKVKHAVITSVDRDDLIDGGAEHWVKTIQLIRSKCPKIKIETLIPDFQGKMNLVEKICKAEPDVLAHNLETVESLQSRLRPQCRYTWSLDTLRTAAAKKNLIVKSSLMLGLGEKEEEVVNSMKDLVSAGCQILSLGQYLRPSSRHLEVVEFIHPDKFSEYKEIGESLGFKHVEAGPLVRSSYLADKQAQAVGLG